MTQLELLQAQVESVMVGIADLHSAMARIELRQNTLETFVNRKMTSFAELQTVGKSPDSMANIEQGSSGKGSKYQPLLSDYAPSDIRLKVSEKDSKTGDLASAMSKMSESVKKLENGFLLLDQSLPVFENRFIALETSLFKLQDDISSLKTEDKNSAVQDSLITLNDRHLPTMEKQVINWAFSLQTLVDCFFPSIQKRVEKLETSENAFQSKAMSIVETHLNISETSHNKFRETTLKTMESRLSKLEEFHKELTSQMEEETKSPLQNFETSMEKLYDQDLPAVESPLHGFQLQEMHKGTFTQPQIDNGITTETIVVVGGYGSKGVMESYNPACNIWKTHEDVSDRPYGETLAVTVRDVIVIIERDNKRTRSLDFASTRWTELESPPVYRDGMRAAADGNLVYLTGGLGDSTRCDVYDYQSNHWSEGPNLNVGRRYHGSATLAGKIYCCGGGDWKLEETASTEVFDLTKEGKERWTSVADMTVRRSSLGLASCSRFLWAVGRWRDLERYDPVSDIWTKMADMEVRRRHASVCCFSGKLYAIGGFNGSNVTTDTVESYDPEKNSWTIVASLNRGRGYQASCVFQLSSA